MLVAILEFKQLGAAIVIYQRPLEYGSPDFMLVAILEFKQFGVFPSSPGLLAHFARIAFLSAS
jgi:hypothetical protein